MPKIKLTTLLSLLPALLLISCAAPKAKPVIPAHLLGIHVQKRDDMPGANNPANVAQKTTGDPSTLPDFPATKPGSATSQVASRTTQKPRNSSGDGLRLPDMLSMPGDNELRSSSGKTNPGSGSVIARPPSD